MKKLLTILSLTCLIQTSFAEIVEVYRWEAYPGRQADMLATMQQAAGIHTSLGATIQINSLDIGSTQNLDYVMRYDDLASWGESRDKNMESAEWAAFYASVASNPAGKLVASFSAVNNDADAMADDFDEQSVFNVSVWDPRPGSGVELAQGLEMAKGMHERMGARVEIYVDLYGGTDKMHYVMSFDSWTHHAEVFEAMESDEAWLQFIALNSENPDPAAALVERFAGRVLANF
ncbi:NIPSNAP family protein [Gammaproteobacteria bacterium]|nr:NIPSNAP family protein [Gammaproteobacteria bacterium]